MEKIRVKDTEKEYSKRGNTRALLTEKRDAAN